MESENRLSRLLHLADACIPVGEGVGESTAKRADRLVQRKLGRDLAAVYQPFGATADAREQGPDEDLTGRRPRCGQFPDLHTARRGMKYRMGGLAAHLPAINLYKAIALTTKSVTGRLVREAVQADWSAQSASP